MVPRRIQTVRESLGSGGKWDYCPILDYFRSLGLGSVVRVMCCVAVRLGYESFPNRLGGHVQRRVADVAGLHRSDWLRLFLPWRSTVQDEGGLCMNANTPQISRDGSASIMADVDESERVLAVRRLNLLDTPPEERFDRIVRLAQSIFNVRFVAVNLLDEDRQYSKATVGFPIGSTPRAASLCTNAIGSSDVTEITDLLSDPNLRQPPCRQDRHLVLRCRSVDHLHRTGGRDALHRRHRTALVERV